LKSQKPAASSCGGLPTCYVTRAPSAMDKYRKVVKPREQTVKEDDEIRVTAAGSVSAYIAYAAKVYNEMNKPKVVLKGTGNALAKVVTAAEVIKRRFKGLHQVTNLGNTEIIDEYEPLEEGLDKVVDTRNVSFIEITLSKEALDTNNKGYQPPLPEDQVKDYDPDEIAKGRGRGGGRGRGRGKGKGKGKSPKGKGKGKGKDSSPKGKGKGKGKDSSPKGKGKDKGKGKGKGKDASPKGKGKGKSAGGKGEKSKGKGKSSDYGSRSGGWDSWWEEEYYPPAKSKGKGKGSKGKGKASSYDDWYDYGSYGSYGSSSKGKGKGSKGKGKGKGKSDYYY